MPCSLRPQGDDNLRSSYSRCMQQLMGEAGARPVSDILDVGASTGLSSLALLKAFPDAAVTGEMRGDGGGWTTHLWHTPVLLLRR